MIDAPRKGWIVGLPWVGLACLASALAIQKIYSIDYFWHLLAGEWILASGSVPAADPFSYTAAGEPWLDIHWLFQVALHLGHRLGGHPAAVALKLAAVLATLACLATIGYRRDRAWLSATVLSLVVLAAGYRLMPRPELWSFVFLAAELALFERFRSRTRAGAEPGRELYIVVLIQLVWSNSHGLFAVGLATCAIYFGADVVANLRRTSSARSWEAARALAQVGALSTLAAFVTPHFVEGFLYPFQQLGMLGGPGSESDFSRHIVELYPPLHPKSAITPLAASFPLALTGLSLAALWLNRPRLELSDVLLWLAFAYLALTAQRNIALFAIVAAPIAVRNANEWLDERAKRQTPSAIASATRASTLAALGVSAALFGLTLDVASNQFYDRMGGLRESGVGLMTRNFPIGATDWIAREKPPGPIHHGLGEGGYLLWRLFPDYRSYLDGRLEVFGLPRIKALQATSPERFRALDQHFHFGLVLVEHEGPMPLHAWLDANPGWRLGYVDDRYAVFARTRPGEVTRWSEVDVDAEGLFAPLAPSPTAHDLAMRRGRVNFYSAMNRPQHALDELELALARHPDLLGGQELRQKLRLRIRAQQR